MKFSPFPFALLLALLTAGAFAAERPNIVVILCDDLGYGDVKANNPECKIATPHMDRIAREGVRFTDAHTPSSVCSPTRYGLLTGRYNWRSKLKSGVLGGFSPEGVVASHDCVSRTVTWYVPFASPRKVAVVCGFCLFSR